MVKKYIPEAGDLVWINFSPQSGHEQRGHRPALCVSPRKFNRTSGLALFCPITSKAKGYPMEEPVHNGEISGVVLCDQVRSLDFEARGVTYEGCISSETLEDVRHNIRLLIE
jgi:mRNA interferase MazF